MIADGLMHEVDGPLQLGDVVGDVGGVLVVWAKERHEVGKAPLRATLSILCDTTPINFYVAANFCA